MKLAYPLLSKPIEFEEGSVSILVIENARELRNVLLSLKSQIMGNDGEFVLSEKNEIMELSKNTVLVTDLFEMELESRRIDSKFDQSAIQAADEYVDEFQKILASINELGTRISMSLEPESSFSALESPDSLIKLLHFHVEKENLQFSEQILEYMRIQRLFFGKKLFIFYNLKACLTDYEVSALYKAIQYEKYHVLLVEDVQRAEPSTGERIVIVDKDLCII